MSVLESLKMAEVFVSRHSEDGCIHNQRNLAKVQGATTSLKAAIARVKGEKGPVVQ